MERNINRVTSGTNLSITAAGHRFRLRLQRPEDRDCLHPKRGLCMLWETDGWLNEIGPAEPELHPQIEEIYAACVEKFAEYADARRVLMLDPHGEVRWNSARWWNELLKKVNSPAEVDEIWLGSLRDDGCGGNEWHIARVFGGHVDIEDYPMIPTEEVDAG